MGGEEGIKKKIYDRLIEKIKESGYWTDEQLEKAKNIMENQTREATDYVYDKAECSIQDYTYEEVEDYFIEVEKKAMEIAENEMHVNPNFDIEMAIEKEQEIKAKVEAGELTSEEAIKAYAEPILDLGGGVLQQFNELGIKNYQEIYDEMDQREITAYDLELAKNIEDINVGQVNSSTITIRKDILKLRREQGNESKEDIRGE